METHFSEGKENKENNFPLLKRGKEKKGKTRQNLNVRERRY